MSQEHLNAPRWSQAEDALLVPAYRDGGIRAAMRALPHRTRKAISARIQRLKQEGVEMSRPVFIPNPSRFPNLTPTERKRIARGESAEARRERHRRQVERERLAAEGLTQLPPRFDSHALLMRLAERMPPRGTKTPKTKRGTAAA